MFTFPCHKVPYYHRYCVLQITSVITNSTVHRTTEPAQTNNVNFTTEPTVHYQSVLYCTAILQNKQPTYLRVHKWMTDLATYTTNDTEAIHDMTTEGMRFNPNSGFSWRDNRGHVLQQDYYLRQFQCSHYLRISCKTICSLYKVFFKSIIIKSNLTIV